MNYLDILDSIRELPEFSSEGEEEPRLSKPLLFQREDRLYCVMMFYGTAYEEYPNGYLFVDTKTGEVQKKEPKDAMEFLEMPDEVLKKTEEDEVPDPVTDELYDLFDRCVNGERELYEAYLKLVLRTARPIAKRIYAWIGENGWKE